MEILKDVKWVISGENYTVKNVPHIEIEEELFLDIDTSIKVVALRDLMVENQIPNEIDYSKFDGIEF